MKPAVMSRVAIRSPISRVLVLKGWHRAASQGWQSPLAGGAWSALGPEQQREGTGQTLSLEQPLLHKQAEGLDANSHQLMERV